jgi:hypothetical protein
MSDRVASEPMLARVTAALDRLEKDRCASDRIAQLRAEVSLAEINGQAELAKLSKETKKIEAENMRLWREVNRLNWLINSPQTVDFMESVRFEAAHQVERWGVAHDAGKRPEDWVTLITYILGKTSKAHFDGDRVKLLHHVVALAAVVLNWHRAMTGEDTMMRPLQGRQLHE